MIPLTLILAFKMIPMMLATWIFLMMICLTILLYAPRRVVLTLMTVWHAWKLRSRGVAGSRKKLAQLLSRA